MKKRRKRGSRIHIKEKEKRKENSYKKIEKEINAEMKK